MRKTKFLSWITCAFLLFTSALFNYASTPTKQVAATENEASEKLIEDFETFRDCTDNIIYGNYFGKFEVNTQADYVTNGNGSIRLNPMGDTFLSKGLPNMQIRLQDADRNLTKLKRVTADFYNATDHDYEIGVFFKVGRIVEANTPITKILLKKGQWTKVGKTIDTAVISLCNDMTDVNSVCFEFELCTDKSKPNDIYMDNVRFEFSDKTPQPVEMTLNENEFCSFDKLYQKEVFIEDYYAVMSDYNFKLSLNSDLAYSKKGKSLKMYVPACPDGTSWGWPNVQFAENLVKAVDLSKYDGNDEFSFWIYNASNINVNISVDFWRTQTSGKRSFTKTIYSGWNNVTMTFDEINEADGGLDILTDNLTLLNICVFPFKGADVLELYLDEMEIIVHEDE